MSEHKNGTKKRDQPSKDEAEHERRSYYYDDSTGYEIYDPAKDDEDEREGNDERGTLNDE